MKSVTVKSVAMIKWLPKSSVTIAYARCTDIIKIVTIWRKKRGRIGSVTMKIVTIWRSENRVCSAVLFQVVQFYYNARSTFYQYLNGEKEKCEKIIIAIEISHCLFYTKSTQN